MFAFLTLSLSKKNKSEEAKGNILKKKLQNLFGRINHYYLKIF